MQQSQNYQPPSPTNTTPPMNPSRDLFLERPNFVQYQNWKYNPIPFVGGLQPSQEQTVLQYPSVNQYYNVPEYSMGNENRAGGNQKFESSKTTVPSVEDRSQSPREPKKTSRENSNGTCNQTQRVEANPRVRSGRSKSRKLGKFIKSEDSSSESSIKVQSKTAKVCKIMYLIEKLKCTFNFPGEKKI